MYAMLTVHKYNMDPVQAHRQDVSGSLPHPDNAESGWVVTVDNDTPQPWSSVYGPLCGIVCQVTK